MVLGVGWSEPECDEGEDERHDVDVDEVDEVDENLLMSAVKDDDVFEGQEMVRLVNKPLAEMMLEVQRLRWLGAELEIRVTGRDRRWTKAGVSGILPTGLRVPKPDGMIPTRRVSTKYQIRACQHHTNLTMAWPKAMPQICYK
ncbi:hypothetical protein BY996DRAFT_6593397 [Phakopsora pachyrhizi]|nr:hypothetical protein BY996DRAFT_6593397 [Phakopsora pachyrhizi]